MPNRAHSSPSLSIADRRDAFWRASSESLLDRKTVAAGIGYTVGWLEAVATHGGGPVLTKIGRSVRYKKSDVLAWLETHSRRINSTAELKSGQQGA